ncbi:tyrosine-type recombinase/integrase [Enterococcus dongliensis]|uniref:tyrosine-type recombinase/integrase n=1 Tax=Enterococcus dongliensis TaxID=2559925 RepID=UPI00289183DA|nr:tyrosine-type recombinase/integrase [Enterococcus dongliensis]MDT2704316.1 tyrosine-type recombinase/integrase [Enterococcus dongliensis]
MPQKFINVKPIKDKRVLNEFATELAKGKHGERDLLIFKIGIVTGLRISDILNLKVSDVKNKVETDIYEIKTKKKRHLILGKITNDIIRYLEIHAYDTEWLFYSPTDHSRHLAIQQYYKILRKVGDGLGMDYIGTHTMRKTFAYHYYMKNHDLTKLMKILNHSSQAITLRYLGIEQEEINATLDDFNPFD